MRKARRITVAIVTLLPFSMGWAFAQAQSQILQKIDQYRQFRSGRFSFVFTIDSSASPETQALRVFIRDSSTALVQYDQPASERGRFVLMSGDDFWWFDRGMAAPIRLSPRQLLFGTASAGDITRILFADMYGIASTAQIEGGTRLSLRARDDRGATYTRIDVTVEQETYRPLSADCYSRAGVLVKSIAYDGYSPVEGRSLLTHYTITDQVSREVSTITLSRFGNNPLPDSSFQRTAMRFLRRVE